MYLIYQKRASSRILHIFGHFVLFPRAPEPAMRQEWACLGTRASSLLPVQNRREKSRRNTIDVPHGGSTLCRTQQHRPNTACTGTVYAILSHRRPFKTGKDVSLGTFSLFLGHYHHCPVSCCVYYRRLLAVITAVDTSSSTYW